MMNRILIYIAVSLLCDLTYGDTVMKSLLVTSGKNGAVCGDGLRYSEGQGCEDIDECREIVPCQLGQRCRNYYGSYQCVCPRGYNMDIKTNECVDKDECAMGFCGNGQKCTNTLGSFHCECSQGMQRIGRFCRDINECMHKPCADNQYCINTRGSYVCQCKAGYREAGNGTCADVDECRQGMCGALGETCKNTDGSYECVCKPGYGKDEMTQGRYCKDIDECKIRSTCPQYSECQNLPGSFLCRCHRGFTYINGACVDKHECTHGEGRKCQWKCTDLPGSYKCICPEGYEQINFNCIDINECDRHMSSCGSGETCVNTRGGFECVRPPKCPLTASGDSIYRKVMKTDEFGYRQVGKAHLVTTNICRRQRCGKMAERDSMSVKECKAEPLSVSYHYVAVTSGLPKPTAVLHISYPARRRRQRYNFSIVQGNEEGIFMIKQHSMYMPRAQLVVTGNLNGPSRHTVKIDMATYQPNGKMRDSRMLTITIFTSMYDF
ncbi:uncharacterized protein LOC120326064 isoform X1 [Styela clava]